MVLFEICFFSSSEMGDLNYTNFRSDNVANMLRQKIRNVCILGKYAQLRFHIKFRNQPKSGAGIRTNNLTNRVFSPNHSTRLPILASIKIQAKNNARTELPTSNIFGAYSKPYWI